MNIYKKTALLHMIHMWTSLFINQSIPIIAAVVLKEKLTFKFLAILFLIGLITVYWIISKISLDMIKDDTSIGVQIFRYSCAFALSCIIVYDTYTRISHLLALIIVGLMILEIIVAILIPFRYRIINKFKKIKNRHKK